VETKSNFSLTEKCFLLTNFSNSKQTQKSLENDFQKITFRQTNRALVKFFHNHYETHWTMFNYNFKMLMLKP
jgi:hypothetical protein